ncbi:transcriptional regulator [Clostridium tetani]|uniref:transcriptional regulator n=1 Tax=Clostridium tetani TaxID=1513 RepID=UPI001FB0F5DF|nr:transcriptional regulator [Clostridium tetani]
MSNEKIKEMKSSFYKVNDIKEILGISESKAYKVIQQLNRELKEMGYITIAGRVPIKYFKEKYYC